MAKQSIYTLELKETKTIKGKNTLVLEIVRTYVKSNPTVTIDGLKKMFNNEVTLLRGGQVITLRAEAEQDIANIDDNGCNYFLEDPITLNDGTEVIVWRYWPSGMFDPFIAMVKRDLGYIIEELEQPE